MTDMTPILTGEAMVLTCRVRLQPTRQQRRALEAILEQQRQLYNAACHGYALRVRYTSVLDSARCVLCPPAAVEPLKMAITWRNIRTTSVALACKAVPHRCPPP